MRERKEANTDITFISLSCMGAISDMFLYIYVLFGRNVYPK